MQPDLVLALFLILGLLSGLIGGLLGIGGGILTVPVLYYIFIYTELYPEMTMQVAVSTSLAAAFVTSGISSYFQWKKRAIQFAIVKWMAPALVIGCIMGAYLAHHMESRVLELIFASIAALMGVYFFFPKLPNLKIASKAAPSLSLFAFGIGALSSMLGIGGGSVAFPILLGYQVPAPKASATSSTATFISTGIGTAAYLAIAWQFHGYIDLSAWLAISIGSVLTSGIGVKLSHQMPVALIKRIFGGCLILIALSMFFT